jgi:hypothetical protein
MLGISRIKKKVGAVRKATTKKVKAKVTRKPAARKTTAKKKR